MTIDPVVRSPGFTSSIEKARIHRDSRSGVSRIPASRALRTNRRPNSAGDALDPQKTKPESEAEASSPAEELLYQQTYRELRRIADRLMGLERRDHTLQPTALVHEAWVRLGEHRPESLDREHFLATAARAMRNILIDHARAHRARKRGGESSPLALDSVLEAFQQSHVDLVELDQALDQLKSQDEELAKIVELRFFGGLTEQEAADVLGISKRSVSRGWTLARNWLRATLTPSRDR